jgi:hypothetical protein
MRSRRPTELWDAAVELLAKHSSSEIRRALGLNATRFKETREARRHAGEGIRKDVQPRGALRATGAPRTSGERADRPLGAFVELQPLAGGPGELRFGAVLGRPYLVYTAAFIEGPSLMPSRPNESPMSSRMIERRA